MSDRSCYRSFFPIIPFPSGNRIQTLSNENPTADTKIIPRLKTNKKKTTTKKKETVIHGSFIPSAAFHWDVGAVLRRSGNVFPAVATEQCGWRRDPSQAELVHTLNGCPGDCWLAEKPSPQCDVTSVKFHCGEGGGKRPLPSSGLTNDNKGL